MAGRVAKPTMRELISAEGKDGKNLRIIDSLAANDTHTLQDFAELLLNQSTIVQKLVKDNKKDDLFIRAVLKEWLSKSDHDTTTVPRTWESLADTIVKAGLPGILAQSIREAFKLNTAEKQSDPGQFRAKLNNYRQTGRVKSFEYQDHEGRLIDSVVFQSSITVTFPNGKKKRIQPKEQFKCKSEAQENAACEAIQSIDRELSMKLVDKGPSTPAEPVRPIEHEPPAKLNSKSTLNNLFHGKLKQPLPQYNTQPVEGNKFQCTITHEKFESVTGTVCPTKKEAEDKAASKALSKWNLISSS